MQDDSASPGLPGDPSHRVFVVHGRNETARDAMFQFLRAIGLTPLEWMDAVHATRKGTPYIGEVLDLAFEHAAAVVVLMTPDEVAYLRSGYAIGPQDPELQPAAQARPNVLFEAGIAMGRDSDRTVLVELGDLRQFSDISGRHCVHLDNSEAGRRDLAERLKAAGCPVVLTDGEWLTAGDFSPPAPLLLPPARVPARAGLPATKFLFVFRATLRHDRFFSYLINDLHLMASQKNYLIEPIYPPKDSVAHSDAQYWEVYDAILAKADHYAGGFVIPSAVSADISFSCKTFTETLGKPVVFVDRNPFPSESDLLEADEAGLAKFDNEVGRKIAAGLLASELSTMAATDPSPTTVLILHGPTQRGRDRGLEEAIRSQLVELKASSLRFNVARINCDFDRSRAELEIERYLLRKDRPPPLIYATNEELSLGARDGVRNVLAQIGESGTGIPARQTDHDTLRHERARRDSLRRVRIVAYDCLEEVDKAIEHPFDAISCAVKLDQSLLARAAFNLLLTMMSGTSSSHLQRIVNLAPSEVRRVNSH
jgi:Predicted nucleotide-binding protein containing TIR-like domain